MDTGVLDFFNKKLILNYYFCLKSGPVFLFQIFIRCHMIFCALSVADPEGGERKKEKKSERERKRRGVFRPSIKHISIHSFAC